jgi:pimeloyl-ACP methyl ester carboxylesterase
VVTASNSFSAAYDAVLAQWPVLYDVFDLPTAYGSTRVHAAGAPEAMPLVLLHGGGATSAVWFANIEALSAHHRVYAVDVICDKGRSVPGDRPPRTRDDLMNWLDTVVSQLGLDQTDLCGHSYGGWIALAYAMHAPARVRRLALLDPTTSFAGFRASYLFHALPGLIRPSAARQRTFLAWETGGRAMNPAWLNLTACRSDVTLPRIVLPKRPSADRLRALTMPTLVLLAEQSRALDVAKAAATARRLLPNASVQILAGASHHSIPTADAEALNAALSAFLSDR